MSPKSSLKSSPLDEMWDDLPSVRKVAAPVAESASEKSARKTSSRKKNPISSRKNAGRKPKNVKKFEPEGGWSDKPLSLRVSTIHQIKLRNLASYRGTEIQVSLYDLLESAFNRYEENNHVDLLSPPVKSDVF